MRAQFRCNHCWLLPVDRELDCRSTVEGPRPTTGIASERFSSARSAWAASRFVAAKAFAGFNVVRGKRGFEKTTVRFVPDDTELGQRIAHRKALDDFQRQIPEQSEARGGMRARNAAQAFYLRVSATRKLSGGADEPGRAAVVAKPARRGPYIARPSRTS